MVLAAGHEATVIIMKVNSVNFARGLALALACGVALPMPTPLQAKSADDLLIVDCLLPGRVQRLGNAATYVTARRAVKIDAGTCRVRGGEYTESGDESYASLMKIWLPLAKTGDTEAQTNLGEIFEKGTGGPPQPDLAVQWYTLAAEQGYSRAQVNLGSLYERGLGVPRNPAKAMEWYRKASGLDTVNISYTPAVVDQSAELKKLRAERDALSGQLVAERRRRETLETELQSVNSRLNGERSSLKQMQDQLGSATDELTARNDAISRQRAELAKVAKDESGKFAAQKKLAQLQQQLEAQRKVVASRDSQLRILRDSVTTLETQAGTLQTKLASVQQERDSALAAAGSDNSDTFAVRQVSGAAPRVDPMTKQVNFGRYHALVIGNDNFRFIPKLRTAGKDAKVVADMLKSRYGFKTTLLLNADRYALLSALNKLRETLTPDDNLLIYYAGHGELDRVNNRGYWLPVDAEADSTANWIPAYQITDILNAMSAKQVMLVADSCYSGTLTRSAIARLESGMTDQNRLRWFQAMSTKHSRVVLTSGGVQPVLDGGGGQHSVFAKAFITALGDNNGILEGQKLAQEVTKRVAISETASEIEQVPTYAPIRFAGHEAGDFFFVPTS